MLSYIQEEENLYLYSIFGFRPFCHQSLHKHRCPHIPKFLKIAQSSCQCITHLHQYHSNIGYVNMLCGLLLLIRLSITYFLILLLDQRLSQQIDNGLHFFSSAWFCVWTVFHFHYVQNEFISIIWLLLCYKGDDHVVIQCNGNNISV